MMSIIEAINRVADGYGLWMLHGGWQGALVAIGVLILLRVVPRIPLSIQYALLLLALAKFVTPPLMSLPSGLFSMVNIAAEEFDRYGATSHDNENPASFRSVIVSEGESLAQVHPTIDNQNEIAARVSHANILPDAVITPHALESVAVRHAPQTRSWWGVLLVVHAIGSAIFMAWIVIQMVRLKKLVTTSKGIQWDSLNVTITPTLVSGIELRRSEYASGPIAFGILKPTVLVPSTLLAGDSKTLESVLLHEVAHIRRRDLWGRWFEIVVQAVWWFNPLVWLVARKLSSVREDICDDFAIVNGHSSEDQYCQTLIDVAAQSSRPVGSVLACGIIDAHPLARRIKRLMNHQRLRARPLSFVAMAFVLIAAVVLLPGVRSQRLALAQAPSTSPEPNKNEQSLAPVDAPNASQIGVPKEGLKLNKSLGRLEVHRIDVQGIVKNLEGKPIAGVTVIIGSARGIAIAGKDEQGTEHVFKSEIARTTSDKDGRYKFESIAVPCLDQPTNYADTEPLNAMLQIVAIADGYGLTWCHSFRYRPQAEVPTEREMESRVGRQSNSVDHVYFAGEPIDIDLTLATQVPLHGQLRDENGEPLSDVVIRLGHILTPNDPIDGEPSMMVYHFMQGTPLVGRGMLDCTILPQELIKTATDAQGRYHFDHVPFGAQIMIGFSHPKLKTNIPNVIQLKAATTNEIEVDSSGLYSPHFFVVHNASPSDVPNEGLKLKARLGRLELHRANVRGVIRNEAGEGVAGASVIIGSARASAMEGFDQRGRKYSFLGEITRTISGKDGSYEFKDLVLPCREPDKDYPYPEPLNAKLQIVAIAEEYGLTWSSVFRYRPDVELSSEASKVTPNLSDNEDWGQVFFHGQDLDVPVTVVKGVTLRGKVVDESGSPIPYVTVRLGRVLMPNDGIGSQPRSTIFRFMDSPFKELGHAPCNIIPEEFKQTKTDAQGRFQLLHVPMKARAGVSFSHPRFAANQFYEISTTGAASAKHDIASGEPLDVVVNTVKEVQLSVLSESNTKLPGSRFEVVSGANTKDSQHSSVATADASGIARMALSEGRYSIRVSPPWNAKLWSTIHQIEIRNDSKPRDISFSLDRAQAIRIKATSYKDGEGVKDIAFEYCHDANPDANSIWRPVTTQGVSSEFARTDHTGRLDALFPIAVMSIRVAGEKTRAMLQVDQPIWISNPGITGIEFLFANRPEPYAEFDGRAERVSRGRYRYRTNNYLRKSDATLQQIEGLVESMRTSEPSGALKQLQEFFDNQGLADNTLIQDGSRRKVIDNSTGGMSDVSIHDGIHAMHFSLANRQCDVYLARDSRRFTPSIGSMLVTPFSATKGIDGKLRFPTASLVPDGENFVRELKSSDAAFIDVFAQDQRFLLERRIVRDKSGADAKKLASVDWQLFPREIDGQKFPTMVIKASFNDEILDRLEIVIFDQIELLDEVPGDTFAMSVPAGTMIIDYRLNPDASPSNMYTLQFATFDVASLLKPISTWGLLDSTADTRQ